MKYYGKIIFLALTAAIASTAITGCGSTQTSGTKDMTTVTVWSGNTHSQVVYTRLIDDFNKTTGKEKGIKIDYQIKDGGSITQSIELALQSGEAPDFFGGGKMEKMVENGEILAIEDLPGGEEFVQKYKDMDVLLGDSNYYNGKTYSVPVSTTTQGLIYNKDMFKAAGIVDENGEAKPPETFDEMREDAKKLTNPAKKQYGIIFPQKWGGWYSSDVLTVMQSSQGFEDYDPATGKYDFSHFAPIMNMIIGMKNDGSVYPGADGLDNDPARALFSEGAAGMKFGFSFDVGVLNDQFPATIDWGVAPYPVADKDNKFKQRMGTGSTFFMNAKSAETVGKDKMMEVLKFFASDEFIKNCYIEGVDIPYDWNIVKDVTLDNPKKGWKEFAELANISHNYPQHPQLDYSGLKEPKDIFNEQIYSGTISVEEGIKLMEQNANAACKAYYDAHPDEDVNAFKDENWDIRR